jgi:hypothetical protein
VIAMVSKYIPYRLHPDCSSLLWVSLPVIFLRATRFLGSGEEAAFSLNEHLRAGTFASAFQRSAHDGSFFDFLPNLDPSFWKDWCILVSLNAPDMPELRCLTPPDPRTSMTIDFFVWRATAERIYSGSKKALLLEAVPLERVDAKVYVPSAFKRAADRARKAGKRLPGIIAMSHLIADEMKAEHPLDAVDFERVKRILYDEQLYQRRPYRKS